MTVRVAVDFGTSSTCAVLSVHGREPQVVVVDGHPLLSSAVYAAQDGTLFVGQEAERQAAVDPSRYEPHPKRRIDEGELLLGDSVLRVLDVVHAVLERAVGEARTLAGGAEVDLLVLTHPADWGAVRTRLLRQAAGRLAREVALVPEPVAAAVFHAATFAATDVNQERTVEFSGQVGDSLAVLDLGGGTVDVSVVRRMDNGSPARRRGGFQVLATRGDPSFGGADVDQALLEHVGSLVSTSDTEAWERLVRGRELADRRRRRVLRQDIRGAKETLSRHTYTDVPMPPPFADAHVTREDLERLVEPKLRRTVELTQGAISDAGLRPAQLAAIFLVGGSSRIPLVSRLVHERTQVVPTTLDQPETVVARGALRAVLVEPDRTGALPGVAVSQVGARHGFTDQRTEVVGPGHQPRQVYPPRPPAPPAGYPGAQRGQPTAQRPPAPPSPQQKPPVSPNGASTRSRRARLPWLVAGAVLLVAAVVTALFVFLDGDGQAPPEGRRFAAFHYSFVAPPGWIQTADNVAQRQVVIKPEDGAEADDLVVVEEQELPYDGVAEHDRLVRELRADIGKAPPGKYTGFNPGGQFAGRTVISYIEHKSAAEVAWFVLAGGRAEVLVGCQYATARDRVMSACEQVVRTLEIRE